MKGKISKIKNTKGELALPITTTEAVYMEDGITKLSDEIKELCEDLKPFEEVFKKPTREQIVQLMSGVSPEEVFSNKSSDEDEKIEL